MCGIAGAFGAATMSAQAVKAMMRSMSHRGPDGSGLWSTIIGDGRELVLGHRRLSILDLSNAGAQPMTESSGRFVLTYNGEIYNYLEIRGELSRLGAVFRSHSDTEVILEAYKKWGVDCLLRFNGMFAFALYDSVRRVLFCARDRYGEKPFLFGLGDDFFAFASEYKALLQHPRLSLEIDEWRLLRGVHNPSTGLDADRQTVFKSVQQLLPSEAMEIDLKTMTPKTWRYWQIDALSITKAFDERAVFAEFRELLTDAVRLRLRSDVQVGSCLSGGLDSSAIVCIVRQLLGDDAAYNTFTGRFPGSHADEWHYASQVVAATGVRSHVVEPSVDGFLKELPRFMWFNELPVGGSSQYAQWSVFRLAKETGVTVLLDGQGADEMLGGYEQYFQPYVDALQASCDLKRSRRELPQIRARYPLALTPRSRLLRDRLPFRLRHWLSNKRDIGTSLLYGLRPEIASGIRNQDDSPDIPGFNPLANALLKDSFGKFLTTLLRYGDRNSMAHSREVRLPFCDHRIAELVFSLPPHILMGEIQTKRLLRESMRGILPENIRTRWNKQGFRPPQEAWFQSPPFMRMARAVFHSDRFRTNPFWQHQWWIKALDRIDEGEVTLNATLWAPIITELWREHFLKPLAQARAQSVSSVA